MKMAMEDLITKQEAVTILCKYCPKRPEHKSVCEEICTEYADIMSIEPHKNKEVENGKRKIRI